MLIFLPPNHREVGFNNASIKKNEGQFNIEPLKSWKTAIAISPSIVEICLQITTFINDILEGTLLAIGIYYYFIVIFNILN